MAGRGTNLREANFGPSAATDFISARVYAPTSTSGRSKRRRRYRLAWKHTELTSDLWWYEQAQSAFDWFLGWNDLGLELYSPANWRLLRWAARRPGQWKPGSGIQLAFLLSLAEMRLIQNTATSIQGARVATLITQ